MLENPVQIATSPTVESTLQPRQLLSAQQLKQFNQRSNRLGALHLVGHLLMLAISGCLWASALREGYSPIGHGFSSATAPLWIAIPALLTYGIGLAFMFCAMHECTHRTAFASSKANDMAAWFTGLLSFYNSTYYRRYHKWHHRYTRVPGKDPELDDPIPETLWQYRWQLTGLPWWWGKLVTHARLALGRMDEFYFLPESSYAQVRRSVQGQLATYGVIALVSTLLGHPLFLFTYWILPLAIGQPVLRFILMAEHYGCAHGDEPLANTRTTLTLWPLRFLMWNMPYHAEHHLYPSIPFHALPESHQALKDHFERVDAGYLSVHQDLRAALKQA